MDESFTSSPVEYHPTTWRWSARGGAGSGGERRGAAGSGAVASCLLRLASAYQAGRSTQPVHPSAYPPACALAYLRTGLSVELAIDLCAPDLLLGEYPLVELQHGRVEVGVDGDLLLGLGVRHRKARADGHLPVVRDRTEQRADDAILLLLPSAVMVDDAEQHSRVHGARGIVGLVQRRLVREPHPEAARARRRGGAAVAAAKAERLSRPRSLGEGENACNRRSEIIF